MTLERRCYWSEEYDKISEEEVRIKIAELCGWKILTITAGPNAGKPSPDFIKGPNGELALLKYLDGNGVNSASVPDYLHDLNACHEMEGCIPKHLMGEYGIWLERLGDNDGMTATAAQRCKAFVLTMTDGK
jgi:hypothetical protein